MSSKPVDIPRANDNCPVCNNDYYHFPCVNMPDSSSSSSSDDSSSNSGNNNNNNNSDGYNYENSFC